MDDELEDAPDCEGCRRRDEIIAQAMERIDELESLVAELRGRVASLEARLDKNSSNSSKPPSSDGPQAQAERHSAEQSDRNQGAQPGHEAHFRPPFDEDEVDEIRDIKPDHCRACGHGLSGSDPHPTSHQVVDVEIKKQVVEYRNHSLACGRCGSLSEGQWPDEMADSQFGPQVSAVTTYLTGKIHVSRRKTVEALSDLFDIDMSLGTVSNKEAETTEALEAPYRQAREWLTEAGRVHIDETSWTETDESGWLWVITDGDVAAYLVDPSRGAKVARELLGGQPSGDVVTDRHTAYNWIETDRRHVCWPHLLRNFKGWALEEGLVGTLGGLLASYTRELFRWLERIRDGTVDEDEFRNEVAELRDKIRLMLEIGAKACEPSGRFDQLLALEEAMWSFVDADGWPTDNNAAERAVRDGVLWRKQSFGTESKRGSRFVERMLTVVETLKAKGRSTMDFLEATWRHIAHGQPQPRLLPA